MRVIIAGSREIDDKRLVWSAVRQAKGEGLEIDEVVAGGARGVDTIAEKGAKAKGVPVEPFHVPDWLWDVTKAAGHMRNEAMARYADALVAVWDGESTGTKDMIERALKHDLQVWVFVVTDGDVKGINPLKL